MVTFCIGLPFSRHAILNTAKVFERTNRNMPARNTLVQLLALYIDLRATMHSVTDRQTDDRMMPIADHTV